MTYHCFSVLEFEDGTASFQKLYSGSLDKCQDVLNRLSAVCHSGPKHVLKSYLTILDDELIDELRKAAQ